MAAPIKLLVFLHSLEAGGVASDALRLVAAFATDEVETHLAIGRATGPLRPMVPRVPLTVFEQGRYSTASFETLWMIWKLPREIRRVRPDVILCAGNTYSIVAMAMWLRLGRSCPPIVLKVSNDLRRKDMSRPVRAVYQIWLKLQVRCFAAIVGMAAPAAAEISDHMAIAPERVTIIPNGSITAGAMAAMAETREAVIRERRGRPRSGRHYLAIGRLVPQKNFALLLAAFAEIASADDRLVIAGDGPLRGRLMALATHLGISERLTMPGYINPIDALLADADVFVLSSDYEGLGVVVVEALAAGLPIVATDCCVSMASLVGNRGTIVPVGEAAALAAAMAAQAPLSPAVRIAAAADMACFTVEHAADAYLALFRHVADSRR